MSVDIKVRNAIAKVINLTSVEVVNDGRPRGTRRPISFNNNGIYIKRSGAIILGDCQSSLNIIIEGGNPNWDGAFVQDGALPYYPSTQINTLLNIINFIKRTYPSISINTNGILAGI